MQVASKYSRLLKCAHQLMNTKASCCCMSLSNNERSASTACSSHSAATVLDNDDDHRRARATLRRGTLLTAASSSLVLIATSLTMPYRQSHRDALGCDSMCVGSLTSARSAATLIGASVVGRLSDSAGGKVVCLVMGVAATATSLWLDFTAASMHDLWWAVLPTVLQQNLAISKALVGEYHYHGITAEERTWSAGILGMSAALAFMLGPFLGTVALETQDQAFLVAIAILGLAAALIYLLPQKQTKPDLNKSQHQVKKKGLLSLLDVPSARSPAALFLISYRVCSALSAHMYQTVWSVYMKEQLHFGPKDYGTFFSLTGFFFALSQGILAPWCLERLANKTTRGRGWLLAASTLVIAISRYLVVQTLDVTVIYVLFSIAVIAWGITSTIVSADTTQIAAPHELGSFFGLLAAMESGSSMVGSLLGVALGKYIHPDAPLLVVIGLNLVTFGMVCVGYDARVVHRVAAGVPQTCDDNKKDQ